MAEEDEIDVLGDFSFNSCFAQNNQGIPSCSDREDTVHPQWLLDSVSNNWYDNQTKNSFRSSNVPSRKIRIRSSSPDEKYNREVVSTWTREEKDLLVREMELYGRNIRKISQTLKTKTEAEIQALIEAEYGVHLETPSFGLDKPEEHDDIPSVVQEEIVTDDMSNILSIISTGTPTIPIPKPFRKKTYNTKAKKSILKPTALDIKTNNLEICASEIFYEDDMIIGSTESVGSDAASTEILSKKFTKQHKDKVKAMKKIGNHRRKISRNYDKGKRNKSKDALKSPLGRQRKDSSVSEDSTRSPKMQIVLGSGLAVPVSEGEQVIKIEKKNDSDPESDIEVDVDSDTGDDKVKQEQKVSDDKVKEEPIAVPLRKLQPMPKRSKKMNLSGDGAGGFTIMHTAAGDLYEVGAEPRTRPRRERAPRKPQIHLIQCRLYTNDYPAPYEVRLNVSCLISMDAQAHTSRGEVMGLAGGLLEPGGGAAAGGGAVLTLSAYVPAAAAACGTHCEMDPVSQAAAAEYIQSLGLTVCAWHHSHPTFPPSPSALDLHTQRALQRALERNTPLLGIITSQHWATGRSASQYRCIRVEDDSPDESSAPTGYQFPVRLVADLTPRSLPALLARLRAVLRGGGGGGGGGAGGALALDMPRDRCPQAGTTYLEKCLSSISHHMRSAGYEDDDPVTVQLLQGIKDVFR